MANYYEILGLHTGATAAEIKSAFRRLAKLYHPDKNTGGKEQFAIILKAYETLSNYNLKTAYDYRLYYNKSISQNNPTKSKDTKTWSFDEKELKRRKYYDEHIKKYAKTKAAYQQTNENKNNYNEFKYILFATPIAVALLFLILYLASPSHSKLTNHSSAQQASEQEKSTLVMGDSPYSKYFGGNKYDTTSKLSLLIKNNTGIELIICLFNKQKFIRSCYIDKGYYVELLELPKDSVTIRYCSGLYFNTLHELKAVKTFGAFKKNLEFFESNQPSILNSINELTLHSGLNPGFIKIDETTFFLKE